MRALLPALLLCLLSGFAAPAAGQARADGFVPLFSAKRGAGVGELEWAVREGKTLTGHLAGPSAFVTLPEGDVACLDTRNARIVLFDPSGAAKRTLDLAPLAAEAKLKGPVVPVALEVDPAWRFHVGDEGNACVLTLDPNGNLLRVTGGPGEGPSALVQVNRIHATGAGELWVEDHARQRTLVFAPDGAFLRALDGFTNLLVDRFGNFTLPLFEGDERSREIVRHAPDGTPIDRFGKIVADGPIRFIRSVGADAAGDLHFALDTDRARIHVRFHAATGAFQTRGMAPHDPGLAVATPEWVTPAGDLCRVSFTAERMTVERLAAPFGK